MNCGRKRNPAISAPTLQHNTPLITKAFTTANLLSTTIKPASHMCTGVHCLHATPQPQLTPPPAAASIPALQHTATAAMQHTITTTSQRHVHIQAVRHSTRCCVKQRPQQWLHITSREATSQASPTCRCCSSAHKQPTASWQETVPPRPPTDTAAADPSPTAAADNTHPHPAAPCHHSFQLLSRKRPTHPPTQSSSRPRPMPSLP